MQFHKTVTLGRTGLLTLTADFYSLAFGFGVAHFPDSQSTLISLSIAFFSLDITFGGRV